MSSEIKEKKRETNQFETKTSKFVRLNRIRFYKANVNVSLAKLTFNLNALNFEFGGTIKFN